MAERLASQDARLAAEALERARVSASQLDLFGAPVPVADGDDGEPRKPGRPAGSRNRVKTALRDMLIAQGFRDPAHQLTRMAGLHSTEDAYLIALARAQAILAAAGQEAAQATIAAAERMVDGARDAHERKAALEVLETVLEGQVRQASKLPDLTVSILREMRQAADSLMPYVFAKVSPDVMVDQRQMFVQMAAPGSAAPAQGRIGPPSLPAAPEPDQDAADAPETVEEGAK